MGNAHCPYSRYAVGAALLTSDESVFTGCNVENSSYGLTICAERAAVCAAIAAGRREFVALAVVAGGAQIPRPCGACLQVLSEFCKPELIIYAATASDLTDSRACRLSDLLPHPFDLRYASPHHAER